MNQALPVTRFFYFTPQNIPLRRKHTSTNIQKGSQIKNRITKTIIVTPNKACRKRSLEKGQLPAMDHGKKPA